MTATVPRGGRWRAGRRIVLFGTGPVAKMAHFLLTNESAHEVVACTVDRGFLKQERAFGLPVVPFEEVVDRYPPDECAMFVAVGYRRMNHLRAEKCAAARSMGYELVTHVSPRASTWADAVIGDNCLVMDQVVVHPFVRLGNDVIVWSGAHIGHESVVEDDCFIASHAVVSGFVSLGRNSFVGTNATIRDGVRIAPETVVGAGAVITKDTRERGVYVSPKPALLAASSDRLPNL